LSLTEITKAWSAMALLFYFKFKDDTSLATSEAYRWTIKTIKIDCIKKFESVRATLKNLMGKHVREY
jgi:hypothetical protein